MAGSERRRVASNARVAWRVGAHGWVPRRGIRWCDPVRRGRDGDGSWPTLFVAVVLASCGGRSNGTRPGGWRRARAPMPRRGRAIRSERRPSWRSTRRACSCASRLHRDLGLPRVDPQRVDRPLVALSMLGSLGRRGARLCRMHRSPRSFMASRWPDRCVALTGASDALGRRRRTLADAFGNGAASTTGEDAWVRWTTCRQA
jgi:hypothetical protein